MGILNDVKRSSVVSLTGNTQNFKSYGALCKDLIDHSPMELHELIMCQFLWKNKKILKQTSVPWFLPEHLLGVGLPQVGSYKLLPSDAYYIPSISGQSRPRRPDSAWKLRNYATSRVESRDIRTSEILSRRELDQKSPPDDYYTLEQVYSLYGIESIFRANNLKELYSPLSQAEGSKQIRRYYRDLHDVWSRIRLNKPYTGTQLIDIDGLLKQYSKPLPVSKIRIFPSSSVKWDDITPSFPLLDWEGEDFFEPLQL